MEDAPLRTIIVPEDLYADQVIGKMGLIRRERHEAPDSSADSRAKTRAKHDISHKAWNRPLNSDRIDYDPDYAVEPSPDDDIPQLSPDQERGDLEGGPEDLQRLAILTPPQLRTRDNMQLIRAKQRFPYQGEDAEEKDANELDPNHLEYWSHRPHEEIEKVGKPDAILIASRTHYKALTPWLKRMKAHYPDIKVIMVQERAGFDASNPPYIDAVVSRARLRDLGDIVRDILEVPQLPKPTKNEMLKAAAEERRLELLNKGVPLDGLPHDLRRPEDTDKRMR